MKRIVALLSLLLLASCWPGWDFICDPTPSREHRVEDLRVLSIEVDTPFVLLPPGLLFQDAPAAQPIEVAIAPRVFDPRGGGPIDVAVALCPGALDQFGDQFGYQAGGQVGLGAPCPAGARSLGSRSAEANGAAPLGPVEQLGFTMTLDTELARALFREAGAPDGTLGVLPFQIVVNVSRSVGGKVERESAYLPWFVQLDALSPDMPSARLDALLAAEGAAMLCEPGGLDACSYSEEAACGDGVVTYPETCEPPGSEGCDEGCYAFDPCYAQMGGAVCLLPPVLAAAPTLRGLSLAAPDSGWSVGQEPDIEAGGVIEVPRGDSVFFSAAIALEEMGATLQGSSRPRPQCAEGTPGAQAQLQCNLGSVGIASVRFYVGDGAADLVAPADPGSGYWGNSGSGYQPVAVAFADGTAAGSEEPLLVVITTDRGAMDSAFFTLVAR